jgi:DNA-binding response OmpR family regulator
MRRLVLVIDDDPDVCILLSARLEPANYGVRAAKGGEGGVVLANAARVHACVPKPFRREALMAVIEAALLRSPHEKSFPDN